MARDFNINVHHAVSSLLQAAERANTLNFSIAHMPEQIKTDIAAVREYIARATAQLDEFALTLKAAEIAKSEKVAA